ncbi:hypothetical protein MMC17_005726 [Xylographa soralifera]|nr:hypothetical protein [Xylographa soralifera]
MPRLNVPTTTNKLYPENSSTSQSYQSEYPEMCFDDMGQAEWMNEQSPFESVRTAEPTNHEGTNGAKAEASTSVSEASRQDIISNSSSAAKRRNGYPQDIQTSPRYSDAAEGPFSKRRRINMRKLSPVSEHQRQSEQAVSIASSQPSILSVVSRVCLLCCVWIESHPGESPSKDDLRMMSRISNVDVKVLDEEFDRRLKDSGYQTMPSLNSQITTPYENKQELKKSRTSYSLPVTELTVGNFRDSKRPFVCTHRCGQSFSTKGAWTKHELIHYPQKVWVCSESTCGTGDTSEHFLKRELFKKHLFKSHGSQSQNFTEQYFNKNHLTINSRFPRKCHVPGCFENFGTWKDRNNHFAGHFGDPYNMSQWGVLEDEVEDIKDEALENESNGNDDDDDDDNDDDYDDNTRHSKDDQDEPGVGGSGSSGSYGGFGGAGGGEDRGGPQSHQFGFGRNSSDRGGNGNMDSSHNEGSWSQHDMCRRLAHSRFNTHCKCTNAEPTQQISMYRNASLPAALMPSSRVPRFLKVPWLIIPSELLSLRWLGSGATASVDEVTYQGAKETMARKVMIYRHTAERERVNREVYIMHRLYHPHVVQLLTLISNDTTATILMKPAADYSLAHYLRICTTRSIASQDTSNWFNCLVSGLRHMHERGVLHGDIKPDNILISSNRVMYADFGLSNTIPSGRTTIPDAGFVTRQYAAPEIKRGIRGRASDIWSLGCVFLEMITIMLHHTVEDFYSTHQLKHGSVSMDVSYANNSMAIANWIASLRHTVDWNQTPTYIHTALDACEAMTNPQYERRPCATNLTYYFEPRYCCRLLEYSACMQDDLTFTCSYACRNSLAHLDPKKAHKTSDSICGQASLNTLSSQPAVSVDLAKISSPTEAIRFAQKLDTQSWFSKCYEYRISMMTPRMQLLQQASEVRVWLHHESPYEILCNTDRHCEDPERYLLSKRKHLETILRIIGFAPEMQTELEESTNESICSSGFSGMSKIESISTISSKSSEGKSTAIYFEDLKPTTKHLCSAAASVGSFERLNPTQVQTQVYSRLEKSWLPVLALFDTGTKRDWVSKRLVKRFGVLQEAGSTRDTYFDTRGRKFKPQRSVRLRWRMTGTSQALENWFLVANGPFDILLGSDFLSTQATYTLDNTNSWSQSRQDFCVHMPKRPFSLAMKHPAPKALYKSTEALRTSKVLQVDNPASHWILNNTPALILYGLATQNAVGNDYPKSTRCSLFSELGQSSSLAQDSQYIYWVSDFEFRLAEISPSTSTSVQRIGKEFK